MNTVRGTRRSALALATAVVMISTLGLAGPSRAAEPVDEAAREARRPKTQQMESVPVTRVPAASPLTAPADGPAAKVTWPAPAAATVPVLGVSKAKSATGSASATPGGLPITVTPSEKAPAAPGAVRVEVLDRARTERAGVDGVLLSVSRADNTAAAAQVGLEVDYSAFANAYGGDWASRLRVSSLPACALTTPDAPQCRRGIPLDTRNDLGGERLVAQVPAPPAAAPAKSGSAKGAIAAAPVGLLALSAGAKGSTGSYAATSLAPSGSWQNAGNTGSFSWSYPLRVPPALAGPSPQLSFNYSSASVDGRTGSTNNQTSWVGEGFDLSVGFIERSFKSCSDDGHDDAGEEKYDLCYASDNATMSFAGRNGELVKKSGNEWRLKSDDGTKIQKLTGGFNDDNNDEFWLVTTTDGTRYYFGKGKRSADDTENTNSSWEAPVYGDDEGEPCHQDTFKESRCKQTWRWNLDYVVDTHGNSMTYYWGTETNRYGANRDDVSVQYDRGGYLKRIEYGERAGSENDTKAPAQVLFSVAERCKGDADDCKPDDLKKGTATRWPDVPFDQICTDDDSCEEQWSPTFFTRKRLSSVTTQVLRGGAYDDVDVWTLDQSYPDPADASTASLWLDSITHAGKGTGATITLPKTTFEKVALDNRVDSDGDDRLPFRKYRIRAIQSESGGVTSVNYAPTECTTGDLPSPSNNTRRCYPSFWSTEGQIGEKEDWFHKYVVESVVEDDRTGNSVDKVTHYQYLGGAAWHYDDSELAKAKNKTWSQFRGYQTVRTITGEAPAAQLRSESTYLRGMDGDRENSGGGKTSVAVTASDGTKVTDNDRYQGFLLEQRTFDGVSGPEVNGLVNTPWLSDPTATEGKDEATLLSIAKTVSRTTLDGGKVRRTAIEHSYDKYGMLTSSSDAGDLAVDGDESCTRNYYSRNTDKYLLTLVNRVQTVAVACDKDASLPADAVSDVRTSYDGKGFGETPGSGDVTRTEQVHSYEGGKPTYVTSSTSKYDKYGRLRFSYDADGNATETKYTPADGGPVTGMSVTNALGQTTTSAVDPAFGLVTETKDANNQSTTLRYDALGRLNKVWLAGRDPATDVPDIEHTYNIRLDGPVAVTTKTITANKTPRITHELYDGLLRSLQSQAPTPNLGRIITTTTYDSRGLAVAKVGPFYNKDAPDTNLVDTSKSAEGVPTATETVYDAVGRTTNEIFKVAGTEKWRTTTAYHGDHTDVTPPAGETPTTTYTNAQGLTTRLLEYSEGKASGAADTTTYSYDKADRLATVKDASGNEWKYGYDLLGRRTSTDDPDAGKSSVTYDKLDRVETTTDGRGRTLAYSYDVLGRPKQLDEAVGTARSKLATWTYDSAKNGVGRGATSTRFVGTNAYVSSVSEYDVQGHPKSTSVTIPPSENNLAGTYTAKATYKIDGSPDETTLPAAGDLPEETIFNGYNAFGLPVVTGGATDYVRETTYSNLSEPLQLTLGTSSANKQTWLTYAYEEGTRRLHNVMVDREIVSGNDTNATYAYDAAGNTVKISDKPTTAGAKPDIQCFQYDYLRRLKEAWAQGTDCAATPAETVLGGAAPYWQSFTYDTAGNRTQELTHKTVATGSDVKKVYTPQGVGAKQSHAVKRTDVSVTTAGKTVTTADTFEYDTSGNTTKRALSGKPGEDYTWDAEGHLTEVRKAGVVATSFVYDASGSRLLRRDIAAKSVTLYLGGTELKLDTSTADVKTQKVTATRYYSHGGQLVAMRTKAGVTWLLGGQNGTAEVAVNASDSKVVQRRTLPFGGVRGSTGSWPGEKGFVGGTIDSSTGLTHLGAREYDPATGRFLSVDPVIDFSDPQQLNPYAYGRNNPFAFPDPTGLWWGWSNTGHAALDIIGLVPAFGEVADGINGAWYLAEGNYVDAGLSFASMIPIAGYGASAAKGARYLDDAVEVADVAVDAVKAGDKAKDAAKVADEIVPPATPKVDTPPKPAPPAKPKEAPSGAKDTSPGKPGGDKGAPSKGDDAGGGGKGDKPDCTNNSFVPATLVVLADGSTKPIKDLVVGDAVLATDPATGRTEAKPVQATIVGEGAKDLVDVTIDVDGDKGDRSATVTATQGHPFWVQELQDWVPAGDLQAGALLKTSKGATQIRITAVKRWHAAHKRVYNLTVTDIHTYYVLAGTTPVLVHNCALDSAGTDELHKLATDGGSASKLSPAGRAVQKHAAPNRPQIQQEKYDYSANSNKDRNEVGDILVQEILTDPNAVRSINHGAPAHYGGSQLDIRMTNGIGARWSMRGGRMTFEGFL